MTVLAPYGRIVRAHKYRHPCDQHSKSANTKIRRQLSGCNPLPQRLAQHYEDVPSARRQLIQQQNAMVRQRHLVRQQCRLTPLFVKTVLYMTLHWTGIASLLPGEPGDVFYKPAAAQARSDDGVMGEPGPGCASEANDAVDAPGFNGFGAGHRRQNSGEPPLQHRLPRPRGTEQEVRMRASDSGLG